MAISMIDCAFMRRSKTRGGLTRFQEGQASRRRGRPTYLSDPQLHNRRDQLVQIFEGVWSEIGWELQRGKKADDLIRIFAPVAASESWFRDTMIIFYRSSREPASGGILRKVRAEWHALATPKYAADESNRGAEERLRQVNWALTQAHGSSRRIVKRVRKKRRKEIWKAAQQYRTLDNTDRRLKAMLSDLEASFARQELIRFLKSKRYSLRPLNLANATAGLPYMGWRQSMRRCAKAPCVIATGRMYQIFKAIRYLTSNANKKTENGLVITFEDSIPSLPSRYQLPKTELTEKWFYLERALRQAYRTKIHPKALSFEITKQYFKQLQSQSQVDMVLAEQAKITLSKPRAVAQGRTLSGTDVLKS
jgi:hypothetical protein